jgi:chaperone required for assembly of F1-ATPase
VVRVDITKKLSDMIPNELDTSSSSGIVYVSVPSEQLVNTTIHRIASSFYLEVDVPALA